VRAESYRHIRTQTEGRVVVVLLKGEGPAFCEGYDSGEMLDRDTSFYRRLFDVCTKLMETIQSILQPVIAQVHGMPTAADC
jgi:enoyl-CoA hydratase/carnithine racemase